MKKWNIEQVENLSGKNVIVTGANTGLGYETALAIASKGANVIMACRSQERAEKAKQSIIEKHPKATIDIILLDLGNLSKIESFVKEYKSKYKTLDVLINNAGVMTTPYMKTDDGFEFQNGVNHLGHFALTAQLFDLLKKTKNSRLVVVSSIAHKNAVIDLEDYMFEQEENYTPMKSYRQSKLSNLLFMKELNRRIKDKNYSVKVLAAHPGVSRTELTRYVLSGFLAILLYPLVFLFTQSAKRGALPQLRAALDKNAQTGEYYGPNGYKEMRGNPILVKPEPNANNKKDAKALWELSEKLTNIKFTI
jgi:NAD(P)-dependent dehydrogenase (short-subunit alcohol dehydrogenase family)